MRWNKETLRWIGRISNGGSFFSGNLERTTSRAPCALDESGSWSQSSLRQPEPFSKRLASALRKRDETDEYLDLTEIIRDRVSGEFPGRRFLPRGNRFPRPNRRHRQEGDTSGPSLTHPCRRTQPRGFGCVALSFLTASFFAFPKTSDALSQ